MLYKRVFIIVVIILLLLGFVILAVYIFQSIAVARYKPTLYEKELISYFDEVALSAEYGDNPQKITKWKTSMYLYPMLHGKLVQKRQCIEQMKTLQETITKINSLVGNNFEIILTNNLKKSNAFICITTKEKMQQLYPYFFDGINEEVIGVTKILGERHYINDTQIFIDIDRSMEMQQSTIVEELTHSIGLMNDTEKYSNSILYKNQVEEGIINMEHSPIDEDIIKLLYSPRIKPGMNSYQVEKAIKKILKNKEIELSGKDTIEARAN